MIFNRYSDSSKISKNSRIDSLSDNLGLADRRYNGNVLDIMKDVDYVSIDKRINDMRSRSKAYLDDALAFCK